tara:strand:+ start:819 stop:3266 length:2448 start_codon:yes stop_codon:yes gene_type:complete
MKNIILFFFLFFSLSTFANEPVDEIYVNLQKLYSLKRVLYVAAHPDDENTRALAYFSLGERAETAYLSLTRGDGGQNLIGDELSENLGVLRTQELLAARSFDGARQYFTRAVDFGYSRSAEESFLKWGKEELMSDVVLAIRKFRPDVIITRFPPDSRAGHGHHTASAILAIEAFEKANDPNYLPEQVAEFGVWKTTSIYWNTSVWWGEDIEEKAQNSDKYLIQDIGGYNSLLGKSYNEIGTLARSQHKCQGFGGIIERGSRIEYFEHIEGARLKKSFFENNKDSWTNLINTNFETKFQNLLKNFNFIESEKNIPSLFKLREGILGLKDSSFKTEKLALCNSIIVDCLGLHVEVVSNDYAYVGGTEVEVSMNLINRSACLVKLVGYELSGNKKQKTDDLLNENERFQKKIKFQFQEPISGPYWLKNSFENIFEVTNRSDLGKPEEDPSAVGKIWILVDGLEMEIAIPVTYKWRDPSYGERRRKLISAPLYTVNFDQESVILKGKESKKIRMKIHGYEDEIQEFVNVVAPKGWKLSSNKIEFTLEDKHDEVWLEFDLIATDESRKGTLILTDKNGNKIHSYTDITYDHIATQSIFREAKVECVNLNVLINPSKVAYIKGVDDVVPQAIEQLGFEVEVFEVSNLALLDLSSYSSVVLGIRIYNVHPELTNYHEKLYKYVENGGNLVMQYNTASRSLRELEFGPVPFKLSRNRVTEEDAEVTFLMAEHPIMTTPNKLIKKDFDGWVQERGLYFAGTWDESYSALFSWHDQDEDPVNGALIVANYGKGQFVYTGISFFRELPKGVEGAYRLLANILSYQK